MAEYIDREALIKRLEASPLITNYLIMRGSQSIVINGIIDLIKKQPAADVAEVKHGEWLEGNKRQPCSECLYRGVRAWSYCPNCGAKMDGKENDHE